MSERTPPDEVRTVYLDQFVYVLLAKSGLGRRDTTDLLDVRQRLLSARTDGRAAFPLSRVHYMETWKRGSLQSRRELAAEMLRFSGFMTLASTRSLWLQEIEHAVHAMFGKPFAGTPIRPFGVGMYHAFGLDETAGIPPSTEGSHRALFELALLAGEGAERLDDDSGERFTKTADAFSERFTTLKAAARDKEQRLRISALADFEGSIVAALVGADVSVDEFTGLGPAGLEELLFRIPSMWTVTELRRIRHQNPRERFRRTDLNDLRALGTAFVYCDIVWTDRAWTHVFGRTELGLQLGTKVVSSAHELAAEVDS